MVWLTMVGAVTPLIASATNVSENNVLVSLAQRFGLSSFAPQEFLDPERAFVLTVDAVNGATVRARWDIAEGYYLYRDKFGFDLKDPAVINKDPAGPGKDAADLHRAHGGPTWCCRFHTQIRIRTELGCAYGAVRIGHDCCCKLGGVVAPTLSDRQRLAALGARHRRPVVLRPDWHAVLRLQGMGP